MRVVWVWEATGKEVGREPGQPEGVVLSGKFVEVRVDIWNRMNERGWDGLHCEPGLDPDPALGRTLDDIVKEVKHIGMSS